MSLQRVDDCHSCEKKIMESVTRPWGSSQLIIIGYWSHSGVLMLERMKIQGVYFVEGDDLHRSFLQANGGDCSFLAIQFMLKSTRMSLVLCWLRVLYGGKVDLVKDSSQGYNSFPDLSWYFVFSRPWRRISERMFLPDETWIERETSDASEKRELKIACEVKIDLHLLSEFFAPSLYPVRISTNLLM